MLTEEAGAHEVDGSKKRRITGFDCSAGARSRYIQRLGMEHERDGRNGLVFFARDTTGLDSLNGIPEKHFLGHFFFVIFVV